MGTEASSFSPGNVHYSKIALQHKVVEKAKTISNNSIV